MTRDDIVERVCERVAAMARRMPRDRSVDPRDVAQSVALSIVRRGVPEGLDVRDLLAVNRYAFISLIQDSQFRRRTEGRQAAKRKRNAGRTPASAGRTPDRDDPLASAELAERRREVWAAIARLPEAERAEIRRRYYDPSPVRASTRAERLRQLRTFQRALRKLRDDLGTDGEAVGPPAGPDRGGAPGTASALLRAA